MSQHTKARQDQRKAIRATEQGELTLVTEDERIRLLKRKEPTMAELIAEREAASNGSNFMARR